MARGLSDLQRWILHRAAERPDRDHDIDLALWRIISERYGIPFDDRRFGYRFNGRGSEAQRIRPAVYRACQRLEDRGLAAMMRVTPVLKTFDIRGRSWVAINLTQKGITKVREAAG